MIDYYEEELTNESFKELTRFVKWCNKVYGYYPIVVGGWAVYRFVKGIGSRDIDIIMPSRKSVNDLMMPFYKARNYKQTGLLMKEFYTELKTKHGLEKIYMDVSNYENDNTLKENKEIKVPWQLLGKNSEEWKLKNAICRTPTLELLLAYKVKALRDRQFDLIQKGLDLNQVQRDYLNAKIWKDKQDIQGLLNTNKSDKENLDEILKKTNFKKLFEQTIKDLQHNT